MTRAMRNRSLLEVRILNNALVVNHLLFADDSLFFSLANEKAAKRLKHIFGIYKAVSGKLSIYPNHLSFFGAKVNSIVKTKMRHLLGIYNEGGIGNYLGLPEQWNEKKLCEVIIDEDVDKILAIKISSTARQDLLGWHYNEDDIYTVKSGYWLGIHLPTNAAPIPTHGLAKLKHKIWKTKAPARLKHFLWRFLSKILATGNNLKRRHIVQNDQCRRCCSAAETEDHIFFECPYAKKIWRTSGVSKLTINNPNYTVEKILKHVCNVLYQLSYNICRIYLFGCYGDYGREKTL